ncbi:hypothetical protein A3Q56_00684 [Intoshia linei]|uniref:FANCI solenoid 4 domain-containing protein n=1 Tax=Intoshia linei TaxID=1819745 RepID=A0A177BB59_9BILA|nr:hypothetical protein A3Q56_00684 [Intoshia linei]
MNEIVVKTFDDVISQLEMVIDASDKYSYLDLKLEKRKFSVISFFDDLLKFVIGVDRDVTINLGSILREQDTNISLNSISQTKEPLQSEKKFRCGEMKAIRKMVKTCIQQITWKEEDINTVANTIMKINWSESNVLLFVNILSDMELSSSNLNKLIGKVNSILNRSENFRLYVEVLAPILLSTQKINCIKNFMTIVHITIQISEKSRILHEYSDEIFSEDVFIDSMVLLVKTLNSDFYLFESFCDLYQTQRYTNLNVENVILFIIYLSVCRVGCSKNNINYCTKILSNWFSVEMDLRFNHWTKSNCIEIFHLINSFSTTIIDVFLEKIERFDSNFVILCFDIIKKHPIETPINFIVNNGSPKNYNHVVVNFSVKCIMRIFENHRYLRTQLMDSVLDRLVSNDESNIFVFKDIFRYLVSEASELCTRHVVSTIETNLKSFEKFDIIVSCHFIDAMQSIFRYVATCRIEILNKLIELSHKSAFEQQLLSMYGFIGILCNFKLESSLACSQASQISIQKTLPSQFCDLLKNDDRQILCSDIILAIEINIDKFQSMRLFFYLNIGVILYRNSHLFTELFYILKNRILKFFSNATTDTDFESKFLDNYIIDEKIKKEINLIDVIILASTNCLILRKKSITKQSENLNFIEIFMDVIISKLMKNSDENMTSKLFYRCILSTMLYCFSNDCFKSGLELYEKYREYFSSKKSTSFIFGDENVSCLSLYLIPHDIVLNTCYCFFKNIFISIDEVMEIDQLSIDCFGFILNCLLNAIIKLRKFKGSLINRYVESANIISLSNIVRLLMMEFNKLENYKHHQLIKVNESQNFSQITNNLIHDKIRKFNCVYLDILCNSSIISFNMGSSVLDTYLDGLFNTNICKPISDTYKTSLEFFVVYIINILSTIFNKNDSKYTKSLSSQICNLLKLVVKFIVLFDDDNPIVVDVYKTLYKISTVFHIASKTVSKQLFETLLHVSRYCDINIRIIYDMAMSFAKLVNLEENPDTQLICSQKFSSRNPIKFANLNKAHFTVLLAVWIDAMNIEISSAQFIVEHISNLKNTSQLYDQLFIRFAMMANAYSNVLKICLEKNVSNILNSLIKFYKLLIIIIKQISMNKKLYTNKLEKCIKVIGSKLTMFIYEILIDIQKKNVKIQPQYVPNLVFSIENFECSLMMLSKITHVDYMHYMPTTIARDFKLINS